LDAWVRHYPADVFPRIWGQMHVAAQAAIIHMSDEVANELSRKDDGAHEWVKARPNLIVPLDSEIEKHVQELMGRYPRLVDTKKGRSGCDPFVIAVARQRNLTVITGENATGKIAVPKIPDVCADLGIRCIRILDFFREQKWVLG
jgi:hypothetical protein